MDDVFRKINASYRADAVRKAEADLRAALSRLIQFSEHASPHGLVVAVVADVKRLALRELLAHLEGGARHGSNWDSPVLAKEITRLRRLLKAGYSPARRREKVRKRVASWRARQKDKVKAMKAETEHLETTAATPAEVGRARKERTAAKAERAAMRYRGARPTPEAVKAAADRAEKR